MFSNKIDSLIISGLLILFPACNQEEEDDFFSREDTVDISTDILPRATTRVVSSADGKGEFSEGDKIKLFVLPENSYSPSTYYLTFSGGRWAPSLYWADLPKGKIAFSAYYPSTNTQYDVFKHEVSPDQRSNSEFEKSDLLFATTEVQHGGAVTLNFQHAMSHLKVTLKSNGAFTASELENAHLSVLSLNQMEIYGNTGKPKRIFYNSVPNINMRHLEGSTFDAVLCPQSMVDIDDYQNKQWLTINVGNRTFTYKAPKVLNDGSLFDKLEPGKEVSIVLHLDKELDEMWSGVTHWVYGLKNPPLEDHEKWGYAFVDPNDKDYRLVGLTWQPQYGWFDCNKKDPSGPKYGDQNLCWAATSSNLIHWWMEQNKGFLQRFGEYTGPVKYPNSLDSEIFQLYKKNFKDEGYQIHRGVNWFFNGQLGTEYKEGAGFFKKVFGSASMVDVIEFFSKEVNIAKRFSDGVKSAFRNKQAIGCSFLLPGGKSAHAITVWGVEFDDSGIARALYIADSNDRDWEDYVPSIPGLDRPCVATGIYRRPIQYRDGFVWLEAGLKDAFTLQLYQLVLLGLHQQEWEIYLSKYGK